MRGLRYIFAFLFLSLLLMQPATENLWIMKSITRKNNWTQEIPTRKSSDQVYLRKNFGPTNTHEENFGPTKYPQEKILNPRKTHEEKFWTHEIFTKARWHDGIKPMRTTIARDPRNLAHSMLFMWMLKSKIIDRYSISSNIESRLVLTFFLPFHRIPK